MTLLDFNDRHRLAVLGAAILDGLDSYADESTLENDPDLAGLYNLAAGVDDLATAWTLKPVDAPGDTAVDRAETQDRRVRDARDYVNRLLTEELMRAPDDTRLGRLRAQIITSLGDYS